MISGRLPTLWALVFLVGSTAAWGRGHAPGAEESLNRLEGVISSEHGEPLAGAIVSVFGANLANGALITSSDEDGYFRISGLPPGPYTVRAYLSGFLPSASSRVEVATGGSAVAPISMASGPAKRMPVPAIGGKVRTTAMSSVGSMPTTRTS